jgi:hypothetical protein
LARVAGARPQPLRIVGTVEELELHVARGACPATDPPPDRQPFRWRAPRGARVELVGFHAPGQQGIMTHHGTRLHLHAIVDGPPRATGHVDRFRLQPGAVVHLGAP